MRKISSKLLSIICVIIITTSPALLAAQNAKAFDSKSINPIAKQYIETVYRAEEFIISGNYDSSLYYYTNASLLAPMMRTDIFNMNKLLHKVKNDEIIYYCFYNTFRILQDSTTKESYLQRLSQLLSPEVITRLDSTLSDTEKIIWPLNSNSNIISETLDSLNKLITSGSPMWNSGQFKKRKAIGYKTKRDVFRCLMNLYKQYGSINFAQFHGHELSYLNQILQYNFYNTKVQKKHNDFFENEIRLGNIDPREYYRIVDDYLFDSQQVYGYHTIFSFGDTLIVYQLSEKGKEKIDNNRNRIFMQAIETTHEKQIWQWQHFYEFIFSQTVEILPLNSNQTAIELAEMYLAQLGYMATGYSIYIR